MWPGGPCQQWLAHAIAIGSGTSLAVPRSSTIWNQGSILTHQNCHADLLFNRSPNPLPDPCQRLNALPHPDPNLFPFLQTSLHQAPVPEGIFDGIHHSSQLAKARLAGAFCA